MNKDTNKKNFQGVIILQKIKMSYKERNWQQNAIIINSQGRLI